MEKFIEYLDDELLYLSYFLISLEVSFDFFFSLFFFLSSLNEVDSNPPGDQICSDEAGPYDSSRDFPDLHED